MPPWLPEPNNPPFVGERRLSEDQIAVLRRWAESGAAAGADLPPPVQTVSDGWTLGTPDLVLRPSTSFGLPPGEGDVFRNLLIRTALVQDRFIRAVEFHPGNAPIHHAVLHLDRTAASRGRDGKDGRPGFEGMGGIGTQEPDGHFVGWAPGRGPIVSAEGRPWLLAKGTDLVIELHLIPGAAQVPVQPTIALYFADGPGADAPVMFKMSAERIDIPPGATDYAISDRYTLPVDVMLLSLYPHAHFLGKNMQVHATLPDGTSRTLLHIPQWSFHWQQDYRYSTPVALPRGTTIAMRFTYDNSDRNPDNPHRPPVRVLAGRRSTDEMGNLLLQFVTASSVDRARLLEDVALREAAANIATAEQIAITSPNDVENLTFLGVSYVEAGRVSEAVAALTRSVELDGRSWKTRNELGGALFKAGKVPEAILQLQQAARLNNRDASVQFNLGKALMTAGRVDEGAAALSRALILNPDFAEAHDELGVALFARGRVPEAIAHLRRAVALAPGSAVAHSDLGGALAQAGQREEALLYIRKALALDPRNTAARENLARLQAGRD
jgi:Flp pilus assembly protein TadD